MTDDLWRRLRRACESLAPQWPHGGLNPPATAAQVAAVERLVGQRLPDDVREAYRHFDGMAAPPLAGADRLPPLLLPYHRWASLEALACRWTADREHPVSWPLPDENEPDDRVVRPLVQHAAWLPLGQDTSGGAVCVDLDPGARGRPGQLIEVRVDSDGPRWIACSFAAYLQGWLQAIEQGRLQWGDQGYFDPRRGRPAFRLPAEDTEAGP